MTRVQREGTAVALEFHCDRCGQLIRVRHLGRREMARCENCGSGVVIPDDAVDIPGPGSRKENTAEAPGSFLAEAAEKTSFISRKWSRIIAIAGLVLLAGGYLFPPAVPLGAILSTVSALRDRSIYRKLLLSAFSILLVGLVAVIIINTHMLRAGQPAGGDPDMAPGSGIFIAIMFLGWILSAIGSLMRLTELWKPAAGRKP